MTTVRPFKGYCVRSDLASKLLAPAYDVVSYEEASDHAKDNDHSFFHVSRAEIEFGEKFDPYSAEVYQRARENLKKFIDAGFLVQDPEEIFYIYAQKLGDRTQYGLMGTGSLEEYEKGLIKKHELTRPKKEDDRLKIIDYQNAHAEPVFFTYEPIKEINDIVSEAAKRAPHFDFVDPSDGVHHTFWKMNRDESVAVQKLFKEHVKALYIADGHHRTQAAYRLYKQRKEECEKAGIKVTGDEDFGFVMALIYPCDQVKIWEYNRVLKSLNGKTSDQVLEELGASFDIKKNEKKDDPRPDKKGEFSLFLDDVWHSLTVKDKIKETIQKDPLATLDSEILTNFALRPVFGIGDIRTDEKIDFVGGPRGTKDLEKRCHTDCKAAFALYPVDVREVMTIADKGLIMPPKSTWFAPKPLSGGVVNILKLLPK